MILDFPIFVEGATQSFQVESPLGSLGDGYDQLNLPCGRSVIESWDLQTTALPPSEKNNLISTLRSLEGAIPFQWRLLPEDDYQDYICDRWDETPLGTGLWQINLTISRNNIWEIDECLIRPVDDAIAHPLIPLNLFYGSSLSYSAKVLGDRIDGGVDSRGSSGVNAVTNTWNVRAPLNAADSKELLTFLSDRCGSSFEFRLVPTEPGQIYSCLQWSRKYLGAGWWEWSAEFKRNVQPFRKSDVSQIKELFDFYSDMAEIIAVMQATFADLDEKLDGAYDWLLRYKRDEYPLILNQQWLLVNSFHTVLGRGGYFPPSAGPTEAQAVIARASMYAYYATGKTKWLDLAKNTGDALLNYFYPVKIPTNWTVEDGIRVPHWLINIKSPFVSKGAASTTGDPLNMGHFDLVLDFVNGVAQIPYGSPNFGELVANVYRVYNVSDRLLWKYVFARPISGFEYGIDYWVTNVMLDGIISRQYGDSESPSGRRPTPTTEPVGKIVLATPFTGQAQVVYSTYSGPVVGVATLFEPNPVWRLLVDSYEAQAAADVNPWSEDAYDFLFQSTGEQKWLDARECTRYTEYVTAIVVNPSAWYKRDNSPNPFAYPGSQVILANHPEGASFTATRVLSGDKKDWMQVNVPASPLPFPSAELQNFAVAAKIDENTTVFVEYAHSDATEIEVILSLSKDPFDFTQYYIVRLALPGGGTPVNRIFSPREFLLWDKTRTAWHPYNADNPVYTYSGQGGDVEIARVQQTIENIPRSVWQINLDRDRGFAGAGLVMIDALPKLPLQIYLKHEGSGSANIVVTVAGTKYYRELAKGDWQLLRIPASVFDDGDGNQPSGFITNIEIEAIDGDTTTWIWWAGAEPNELPTPVQTYKAVLTSRVATAHTFWAGQFEAIGSPSNELTFGNGIAVPFTINVVHDGKGGQVVDAWRGFPMTGYQYPAYYVKMGYWDRLRGILDFFEQSQVAYAEQHPTKSYGVFAPGFAWGYWDAGEYSPNGVDVWTWNTIDPNSSWEGYYCRPIESLCHAWYRMTSGNYPGSTPADMATLIDRIARISMAYLNWQSAFYIKRRSFQPPTDFYQNSEPVVQYHTPHYSAFLLRSAMYANLAGGNPAVTMRLIKASYNYLQCEYIQNGLMAGSFFKSQPTFTHNGLSYHEGFGFWMSECTEAIALLKTHRAQLNYPRCVYFIKNVCPA